MSVRAKFRLYSKTSFPNSNMVVLKFGAVSADEVEENQRYHKYTPNGTLEISIDNPPASDFFNDGDTFYLDFTKASK